MAKIHMPPQPPTHIKTQKLNVTGYVERLESQYDGWRAHRYTVNVQTPHGVLVIPMSEFPQTNWDGSTAPEVRVHIEIDWPVEDEKMAKTKAEIQRLEGELRKLRESL